jgi:flagellar protein FlaG
MKIDMVNSSVTMQNEENKTKNEEIHTAKVADVLGSHQLQQAVDVLNKRAEETNYNVQFAIYKDTKRVVVEVVEKITNKVVSTYPPTQILEMARMVDQEFKVLDKKI